MIKENSGIRKTDVINRRMFIIGAAKIIIFTGIIARLFSLQVNENKKYLTLSDKNRIREWKLPPTRGDIVDYFGNVIAGNLKVYQLHIIPEQVENFNYLISRLKILLNLSDKKIDKIVKLKNKLNPWESIIVSENLSWSDFLKINNFLYDLVGVKPVMTISRNYPFSDVYTHILGYVSQPNEEEILANEIVQERFVPGMKIGKLGLEKTLENYLIGSNAIQRYEVNAYGKRINQLEHQKGNQGLRIRLTVDTEIQKACGKLLNDRAGSISVMDIYTGDVIAMYSSPSYDPNKFLFGISSFCYLLICAITSYLRQITLSHKFINDWLSFIVTVLLINSIQVIILDLIFLYQVDYMNYLINAGFTFLFYPLFFLLFNILNSQISIKKNA